MVIAALRLRDPAVEIDYSVQKLRPNCRQPAQANALTGAASLKRPTHRNYLPPFAPFLLDPDPLEPFDLGSFALEKSSRRVCPRRSGNASLSMTSGGLSMYLSSITVKLSFFELVAVIVSNAFYYISGRMKRHRAGSHMYMSSWFAPEGFVMFDMVGLREVARGKGVGGSYCKQRGNGLLS